MRRKRSRKQTQKSNPKPNYDTNAVIIDDNNDNNTLNVHAISSQKYRLLSSYNVTTNLLSLSLFFLKNLFRYLASYSITFLRTGVVKDLRDKLYHKIVELPISYFTEKRKGDIIARMTADVQEVEVSILTSIETIVREPLTVFIAISIMLFISLKLTLFVFILLPVSGFIISSISKKLKANSEKAQKETGTFLSFIEETLTGLRVIKGFNSEKIIEHKFNKSTSTFRNLMTNVFHRQTLASPMSEFLGSATIITILWYGGSEVINNTSELTSSKFLGYILLFYTVLNPIKLITTSYYNIQKGEASAERIMQVLNTENSIKDKPNAIVKEGFENEIEFKNISFKYKDDYVLKDFSLTIKKGETVALVGQSGSGKSTLANLITRFYDVNKGDILIDGKNIKDITKNYDAIIVDLPYNLYSYSDDNIILNILKSTIKRTDRVVIVSLSKIESKLTALGLEIIDSCTVGKRGKSTFERKIWVCKKE